MFLSIVFFLFVVFYLTIGFLMKFNLTFFIVSIIPITHLFLYQLKKFDPLNPKTCLNIFKSNIPRIDNSIFKFFITLDG